MKKDRLHDAASITCWTILGASMKTPLLILGVSVASIILPARSVAADASSPPASAFFVRNLPAKPPSKCIGVHLVLTNDTKSPLWFVLPGYCDKPSTIENPIRMPKGFKPTEIGADGFNTGAYHSPARGSKGRTTRLTVWVDTYDNPYYLHLFRLPAGGTVEFEMYGFVMLSKPVASFKLRTADEIKVNGKQTLENWLPYNTLSDAQTFVPTSAQPDNLNWNADLARERADFPQEPITNLDIRITGTWEVPFQNLK